MGRFKEDEINFGATRERHALAQKDNSKMELSESKSG